MKVTIRPAIIKEIRTISPKEGKGNPFQVISLLDDTGGDLDLTAPADVDLSKVPTMLPILLEATVRPWKSGFSQRLSLTAFTFGKL